MLMILARLVRSESFWAVVKVRSPHTGWEPGYPRFAFLSIYLRFVGERDASWHYLAHLRQCRPTMSLRSPFPEH